jgi:small subunit ribosomal protein S16
MAVKVRMTRAGSRNSPFYRIVVADERSPRDGSFLEQVGTYDPRPEKEQVTLKMERIRHWISKGARPTQTVSELIRRHGAAG